MLNHARTLLQNLTCPNPQAPSYPGDELFAEGFREVTYPAYIETIRSVLFGSSPDRFMLNYRCRQLLSAVHASPLEGHLLELDPRIDARFDAPFLAETAFVPRVIQLSGSTSDALTVGGEPSAPDHAGRMMQSYKVLISSETTLVLSKMQPGYTTNVLTFAPGEKLILPGTGYFFRVNTTNPGASWMVECLNRPQLGLGELVRSIESIGEPNLVRLFGLSGVPEPYATFKAAWERSPELPMRVGGLICALVYRMEEARVGGG